MNSITHSYYRLVIAKEYERRKKANPSYSLRAFAKVLGVDVATLSRVFNNKSSLAVSTGQKIAQALNLNDNERSLFLESLGHHLGQRALTADVNGAEKVTLTLIENDQFELIGNLYHYAILELAQTEAFDSDPRKIAKALGINTIEAWDAIERLVRVGLLKREGSSLHKSANLITTKQKAVTSDALRNHQKQILKNALYRLEAEPIEKRVMSGMTMPIDPEKLPVARELIDEFCLKMSQVMSAGKRRSVYQLHVSFCSLLAPM